VNMKNDAFKNNGSSAEWMSAGRCLAFCEGVRGVRGNPEFLCKHGSLSDVQNQSAPLL
jgi:hypothetical protein